MLEDFFSIYDNKNNNRIRIEDIFCENGFRLFVQYCEENKLVFLDELKDFDFQKLFDMKGMGIGKINAIIKKYDEAIGENNSQLFNTRSRILFDEINPELYDVSIEIIGVLGISSKWISILKNTGYTKVGQLEKIDVNVFSKIVGMRNIDKFRKIESKLKLSLIKLCCYVFDKNKEEKDYLMALERSFGFTLQEIADERGVTRERIRQITKKYFDKISPLINQIVLNKLEAKGYITIDELLGIFDNDDYNQIVIEACHMSEDLEFLDFADVFVQIRKDKKSTEKYILDLATEFIGEGIDLYENLEELDILMTDNGFQYVGSEEFINLIQKYGYKLYGDYAIKGSKSYAFLCKKIIAKKFPNGIKLYESEELDTLRNLVKKQYGNLGIPDNDRAFTSRLTEYLVLCGRGMFTAVENINIEIETIEKIKKFIDERKESVVFYIELFTKFKELLNRTSNINNYHFLHGVLRYYYPEEYKYARDYLTKKENCISATLGDRIKKVFTDNRCPIHKNDLKLFIPGVSEAMLLRAIHEEKELFQWEHNYYFSAQMLSISVTDIEYIHDTILNIMNENFGYCSDNLLYNKVINKLENCFKDNNIKSPSNLFYICTYLFSDEFDFRIPHIGRKGMFDAISMKEIALSMLKNVDEISFNKYSNIAEHLMWAMGTRGMVFSDIEKEYIRISDDRYIKRELFRISDEEIEQIESVICQKMKNNFLSLINFESWGLLPNIKYEWNSFLLRSIIEKLSSKLKIIETRKKNRNFERGIIVNVDSSFSEYSEVVANYLKENGYSTISKSKLLSILIETGLTYKIIPKELYDSESIKYLDEEFVVA